MPPLAILCFHRVVRDDDPHAWPYLERGTAVRCSTFETLLRALSERGTFVDPHTPLSFPPEEQSQRPRFWLTFDDGYRDTLEYALPVLRQFDARASVFVTTEVALGRATLPADQWYSVLLSARRRRGTARVGGWSIDAELDTLPGRTRLVMGAERRAFLEAEAATRESMLAALEAALHGDRTPRAALHLNSADLRSLQREGWSVGGHGATHAILPTLSDEALAAELERMASGLAEFDGATLDYLAWPDGQHSAAVRERARVLGCRCALALGDALATDDSDLMALPRFIVTDDPCWVDSRWPAQRVRQGDTQ